LDAPRTLHDVRDADPDQLLGLDRQDARSERLAVELQKRPVSLGRELAHPPELLSDVDSVKHHDVPPLAVVPSYTPPSASGSTQKRCDSIRKMGDTRGHQDGGTLTRTSVCIVGGGPAGMLLGLLLARRGVDVIVLEGHENFDREFRGEVLQPSTARLLDEL